MRDARVLCGGLALLALILLAGASRASALGELAFDNCSSNDGSGGECIDLPSGGPGFPIGGDPGIALNPKGNAVYVAAGIGTTSQFLTGASGRTAYTGCFSDDGSGGACNSLSGGQLITANQAAVSPNGKTVYVTSSGSDSVLQFLANSDGQLTYDGCISDNGVYCTNTSGTPLTGAQAVAVSPNRSSVYVVSTVADSLTHFETNADGELTYDYCYSDTGSGGTCVDASGPVLDHPTAVAVSPDGKSVYVGSETDNAVTRFSTNASGQPTQADCVSNNGSAGACTDVPGTPLQAPESIAVSPNGKSVYVAGYAANAVTHLIPDSSGTLSYDGCISNDGSGGLCIDEPGTHLLSPQSVAVSPDSKSIYVASYNANSLTQFGISNPQGQLTPGSCFADAGAGGCADVPGESLRDANSVAVSPNGRSVYVSGDGGVAHFLRDDVLLQARLTDTPAQIVKTLTGHAKVSFKFKSNGSGVSFKCKLDSKPYKKCKSPKSYTVGLGKHSFKLKSKDRFGEKDKAKATFKVVRK